MNRVVSNDFQYYSSCLYNEELFLSIYLSFFFTWSNSRTSYEESHLVDQFLTTIYDSVVTKKQSTEITEAGFASGVVKHREDVSSTL